MAVVETNPMSWPRILAVAALTMAPLLAQRPATPPRGATAGTQEPGAKDSRAGAAAATGNRAAADTWSERHSRELFASCDVDGDDRLDLFEAGTAFDTPGSPLRHDAFRRLDRDRDGYLTWPEFDLHFRTVVQRGDVFRVRTSRALAGNAPEQRAAKPSSPVQQLLQLYDADGSTDLNEAELANLVQRLGAPPAVLSLAKTLDLDRSGTLDEQELVPMLEHLTGSLPFLRSGPAPNAALPPPWSSIDRDRDGRIDASELAQALRQLDPQLARWSGALLQAADRNRDGFLDGGELPTPVESRPARTSAPER